MPIMVIGRLGGTAGSDISWLRSAKSTLSSLPPGHVRRDRLSALLEVDVPFTLVTAPPGYGKTVAVLGWAETTDWRVGWLTLDRFDDDATMLWCGITDAIASIAEGSSDPPVPPVDPSASAGLAQMSGVLDALRRSADVLGPLAIVLDELNWVRDPDLWDQLAYLVDHLPPSTRLVGVTRGDPRLPLGRWRAQSRLVEVREADLRFDRSEASALLAPVVDLTDDQLGRVHASTDGWAVALRLVSSAMVDDPVSLLDRLGSDQLLVDYVVSEVVDRLSPDEHQVMVALALHGVLDRAMCTVVCERPEAWDDLLHLADEKLFVMAADARRSFVRLHSLVAELLVAEATARTPGLVEHLRSRSAELSGVERSTTAVAPRRAGPNRGGYDTSLLPVHLEPLTEREMAVLELLPTHLTYGEIASEVFLSINTVKTYVKSIYRKLGVNTRNDSVRAARAVGLL